jgi:glycerol-3-phosphate acyltransferase PlsY
MYQWILSISIFVISFFIGSLHLSYWYAVKFNNINLFKVGTRSVGSSNMMNFVGKKASYIVAIFDFAIKGVMPILLLSYLGCEVWVRILAGLLIVCGHNWSPFLGFRGGRGILTSLGIILGIGMWIEFVVMFVVAGMIGYGLIYRDSGFWTFIGFFLLIGLALIYHPQLSSVIFCCLLVAILLIKRLVANMDPIQASNKFKILFYRLIFDRDIRSKRIWNKYERY